MIEPRVKVTRRNLSASIADDLLFKIKSGQYPPGSKVPGEKELMEAYGVGRNTVREAVQSLVTMGYLDVRPRVGARVTSCPDRRRGRGGGDLRITGGAGRWGHL
jgi:DNA-binding FadR family transcriptional regulator